MPFILIFPTFFSAASGTLILDRLLDTVRQPIFEMKAVVERGLEHRKTNGSGANKGKIGPPGGTLAGDNVSLEVSYLHGTKIIYFP